MKDYRWLYKSIPEKQQIKELSAAINVKKPIATLLCQREITNYKLAKSYFRPNFDEIHDPFLMKDMSLAVNRLSDAIHNNEKILVYGDYDVDGTTSVALVYSFLKTLYPNISYYIPNRYKEGYGVSKEGINYAKNNNFTLIISLDCGIKAVDKIDYANTLGVDFIICDHHNPGPKVPNAVAVLDPKQKDCNYPYKELSGCGVGFKLMQAFSQQQGIALEKLFNYLDLLAISIAADIVPITGENRILTYYGLQLINKDPRPGVQWLIELAGLEKGKITISNVVFGFAPRINAAGRMGNATDAVKLLIAKSKNEGEKIAGEINKSNIDRREIDSSITEEALEKILKDETLLNAKTTVLYNESWHKGVIGIVASRCIETYYRPTIILTKSNGKLTGSARSVDDFDVYKAIENCNHFLEQFGGHKYAAGLTLKENQLEDFKNAFENEVTKLITDDMLVPKINVDLKLKLSQITWSFFNVLEQMAPFGPENMQPIFVTENVIDTGNSRIVGENHLKLSITQPNTQAIEGIAFGMADFCDRIKNGVPFNICYSIEKNEFRGNSTLQLRIRDIKF